MRKANKNLISLTVILVAVLSITITAFADPLSIGIGLPIAEATGVSFGFTGMSASGADAWFNSQSGSDPVQLQTNYVDVDLAHDVPIKYRKNNDGTVDFQIDKDSSIFKYFNNTNGQYNQGAIHTLINNNNIQEGVQDQQIYNSDTLDGIPFNTILGSISYNEGPFNFPAGVVIRCVGTTVRQIQVTYNGVTKYGGSWGSDRYPFSVQYIKVSNTQFNVKCIGNGKIDTIGIFTVGSGSSVSPSTINYLSNLQLANLYGDITGPDFIPLTQDIANAISNGATKADVFSTYSNEDISDNPPQPLPDIPLGNMPFDDWVDLWGQSIWERLTRVEEKQELMVIGQQEE